MSESFGSLLRLSSSSLADLHLNPLYVLPVTAVLILCLLVYAFGFKSTTPVPQSLTSLLQKDGKKKEKKKTSKKDSDRSSSRPVVRANGQVPAGSKSKSDAHVRKQKTQPTSPQVHAVPAADPVADEEDSGDWVPVLTKKKAQKQKHEAEKGAHVPVAEEQVAAEQTATKVPERKSLLMMVDDHVPAKLEVENWDTDELISAKEYKSKKKTVRRGKESRSELVHQLPDATADAAAGGKVVKDKITSEILANYNSVLDTDKMAAAAAKKKKEKRRTKAQTVSQNLQPEKLLHSVPAAAAVIDKKAAVPAESVSSATASVNSFKEQAIAGQAPAAAESADQSVKQSQSSETTDVTDGSDPSDGEFKVVRKRKARRE